MSFCCRLISSEAYDNHQKIPTPFAKWPPIAMATRVWQASCSRGDKAGHSASAHALTKHLVCPGFFRLRGIFFSTPRLTPAQQVYLKFLPPHAILPCVVLGRTAFTVCEKSRSNGLSVIS